MDLRPTLEHAIRTLRATNPFLPVIFLFALASGASAHDGVHPSAATASRMRDAAERVIAALPPAARDKMVRPFDDRDRLDWHYTPRSRNGVALKELDARGRDAVHALLQGSAVGHRLPQDRQHHRARARAARDRDVRPDARSGALPPHDLRHAEPTAAWGWRFEGHHLSLNFTLAGDHLVVDTPSFLGANPANVPRGPRAGLRVLAAEEDEARALLGSLSDAQRREAVFDTRTYGDIVTTNADKVDPLAPVGIAAARLTERSARSS